MLIQPRRQETVAALSEQLNSIILLQQYINSFRNKYMVAIKNLVKTKRKLISNPIPRTWQFISKNECKDTPFQTPITLNPFSHNPYQRLHQA